MGPRHQLSWEHFADVAPEWFDDVIVIPEDASPPLATTPPHPRSTGTYGPEAVEWIERELKKELPRGLRWWQKFAVYRALEHDDEGLLVWRLVLESTPRRSGKSVRLRAMALWRVAHPELFGDEEQIVLHCGRDVAITREIHRKAWRWAGEREAKGWKVSRGVGQEEVIHDSVHRWLVRSTGSVYGYDVTLGYVDEAWDVQPEVFTEGLEPATLERVSAQNVLTSTAHRRATSLMKSRMQSALDEDDDEILLMLWGALDGDDFGSPDVWRSASPHWSPDRERMISKKYEAALRGEADPEADDPDPMAGFSSQLLNVWAFKAVRREPGRALIEEEPWADLEAARPDRAPDAQAVEAWYSDGAALASAWHEGGGRVLLSVEGHNSVAEAVAAADPRCAGPLRVGKSLTADPTVQATWHEPAQGTTRQAVVDLGRAIAEDSVRHDGGEFLTAQVLAVRTQPGGDGPRLVSKARGDAVKAAVWAAEEARTVVELAQIW